MSTKWRTRAELTKLYNLKRQGLQRSHPLSQDGILCMIDKKSSIFSLNFYGGDSSLLCKAYSTAVQLSSNHGKVLPYPELKFLSQ